MPQSSQNYTPQELSTSGLQTQGGEAPSKHGPSNSGPKTAEGSRLVQSPGNNQRSSGGTPGTGQAKTPARNGHLSYIKAPHEGLRTAIIRVYDGYPKVQVSKEKYIEIHLAIYGLVAGLPEEKFTPKLI